MEKALEYIERAEKLLERYNKTGNKDALEGSSLAMSLAKDHIKELKIKIDTIK